ncbi:hypothetical protein QJS10_CPA06g01135 [Acorus calamus]|uniref:Uncharacterized protein n=1 Tax=Acorus calamus TaxID=4465 RepID=A0AAV9ENF6_ACOCL|nr:hypothetical protein QJS10_CPA06g01135 [Acorus calamus]
MRYSPLGDGRQNDPNHKHESPLSGAHPELGLSMPGTTEVSVLSNDRIHDMSNILSLVGHHITYYGLSIQGSGKERFTKNQILDTSGDVKPTNRRVHGAIPKEILEEMMAPISPDDI